MKIVSSSVEFDFKHDGTTTVHVGRQPIRVSDDVATHLVAVFGERIVMEEYTIADDTLNNGNQQTVVPTESSETQSSVEAQPEAPAEEPTV